MLKSIEDVAENPATEKDLKYGLCKFSSECWLYTSHNYHCNSARGLGVNPENPSCYKSIKDRI